MFLSDCAALNGVTYLHDSPRGHPGSHPPSDDGNCLSGEHNWLLVSCDSVSVESWVGLFICMLLCNYACVIRVIGLHLLSPTKGKFVLFNNASRAHQFSYHSLFIGRQDHCGIFL